LIAFRVRILRSCLQGRTRSRVLRTGQTYFNAADRTQPRLSAARSAIQIQHQDQIVRI